MKRRISAGAAIVFLALLIGAFALVFACSSGKDDAGSLNQDGSDDGGDDDIDPPTAPQYYKVDGGEWDPGLPPEPSASEDSPVLESVEGPDALINGGSGEYTLTYSDPQGAETVTTAILCNLGYMGHMTIPIPESTGIFKFWLSLVASFQGDTFPLDFAVKDASGHVSNYMSFESAVVITGVGDIKVSLSFNKSTDLDLHVVNPNGEEIYFGNPLDSFGGNLDLDSNPACNLDGVNNENIFWPTDTAPSGEYIVRVDYYADCTPDPIDYMVAVIVGDDVDIYRGTFLAEEADGGGAGSGREITRFTF